MADEETLIDYSDEENEAVENDKTKESKKGHYVGVHSTGFRDFLLKPELLHAISDCGFEHPSEVQHECIPSALLGGDVLCQAKSGMGKTAVFVLTTLHALKPQEGAISILVIAHTRELAFQISKEYERFSKYLEGIKTKVVYGGISISQDKEYFKKEMPNILVGTPGRLKALIRDKIISVDNIKFFVVDECDKVLEALDMRADVQAIFRQTPHTKQVMMFSATLNKEIREVCKKFMQEPSEVYVDDETKLTLHGLLQYYVKLTEAEKITKLTGLLDVLEFNQVVIFVRSVERAKYLNKILEEGKFPSICIHSGMKMEDRLQHYKEFKDFKMRILVATDVFARGMDVEKVNIVFNFDFPESSDTYLHRVGRAGRFGTKGLAISFVCTEEDTKIYEEVQNRFAVKIDEIPETIDVSKYMNVEA